MSDAKLVANYGAKPWGDVFHQTRITRSKSDSGAAAADVIQPADIASRQASPISLLPRGLINKMNRDEVLDLIAYNLSAGNPKHPLLRP